MDSNFQFRAKSATPCVVRDGSDPPSAVGSEPLRANQTDGPGTLAGGARWICIGYAARGVAGLHGESAALPTGEPPMSIEIIPAGAALGAEIRGVDLARPIDDEMFVRRYRARLQ